MVLVFIPVAVRAALLAALLVPHIISSSGAVGGVVQVLSSAQLCGDGFGASPCRLRPPTRDGAGRRGMALSVLEAHAGSCRRFGCTECLDGFTAAGRVVLAVWGMEMGEVVVVIMRSVMAM